MSASGNVVPSTAAIIAATRRFFEVPPPGSLIVRPYVSPFRDCQVGSRWTARPLPSGSLKKRLSNSKPALPHARRALHLMLIETWST